MRLSPVSAGYAGTAFVLTVLAVGGRDDRPNRAGDAPPEFGRVAWGRDFPAAVARAKAEKKPLMVLFDEVPGCETCRSFGAGPLSHPLVVDAAASEFVPVAVTNNTPGPDAATLKRFGEPAWNNPVVRFLDAREADVIPRRDGEYTTGFVLKRMAEALAKANRPVPEYLRLAAAESAPAARERAVFAMFCYWEGEAKLGQLPGVLGTRIGSLAGHEVVEVEFDPTLLRYDTLVGKAKEMDCTHRVFARTDEQAKVARRVVGDFVTRSDAAIDANTTQQYHLAHAPAYHFLPLTALQATSVNAALAARESPDRFLSPGQLAQSKLIKNRNATSPRAFADLRPDRTPEGLVRYAKVLSERLKP